MAVVVGFLRDHRVVTATLLVGLLGGALELAGLADAARWAVSIFALAVAALQARGMVADLRAGTYGVDILAVTAIVSTVLVGEYWAALVVCLMLSGGEALEDYAAGRARRELSALLERAPQVGHRLLPDGTVDDVAVTELVVGEEVLVKPHELVPVDGVLLSDDATFDESSLTGESLPVDRRRGDDLLSGSVNGGEAVRVRVTAAAADSQYQRIVELVREAQDSKAPFVRLADRVAVPFTAVAFLIAGLAWALSGDPTRFAEVLVVATPCPLIIAAPVAFMAGMSRSASNGVIVKGGGTLEQLARVRTVAFDKTGTLTYGTPRVARVEVADGLSPDEVLSLAAAVEQYSSHPLAAAIVAAARRRRLPVQAASDVEEVTAHGVRAVVGGRTVVVGKATFVAGEVSGVRDVALPPGQTGVHVGVAGCYAGVVALADEIRAETVETLAGLHRAGVGTTMMLTGDAEPTARHIAAEIGIDDVRAGLLPEHKVDALRAVTSRPVMMVGDGVNDAPVLAVADVGVAMGAKGSTAASESADVVVLLDDLYRTVRAVQIGRRTMRVAWQAIGIGVGFSVALMLVAAAGLLPAIVGAWMQEVVDLTCILWALLASRPGREERADQARVEALRAERARAPRAPVGRASLARQ
ncbi:cadmium-translocating P-type ATPase [Georgenia sp. EYE_87]|uniref:heavy metal translocating P-type ATPase n=1 Tax=Georgenia sp. EYE_87 TaxID=2853448 RepID=UPI0020031790|nr:heavy metal translocating P-type ATPase [Georgenia sp. EYE_87]MCK6211051.1 cadmium-translocating P-type ATPase [Georgenia sp. EYE_87]